MPSIQEIDTEIARLRKVRQSLVDAAVAELVEALPAFSPSRHDIEDVARQIAERPGPVYAAIAPLIGGPRPGAASPAAGESAGESAGEVWQAHDGSWRVSWACPGRTIADTGIAHPTRAKAEEALHNLRTRGIHET